MADNADGYTLRKRLAMGMEMPGGNFGCESLAAATGSVPLTGPTINLKDHERGAGPPVGHNQANPNHGDFK